MSNTDVSTKDTSACACACPSALVAVAEVLKGLGERSIWDGGALPTVVIVHGGFFKDKWSARNTQTASLVPFLLERGLAAPREGECAETGIASRPPGPT